MKYSSENTQSKLSRKLSQQSATKGLLTHWTNVRTGNVYVSKNTLVCADNYAQNLTTPIFEFSLNSVLNYFNLANCSINSISQILFKLQ